MKLAVSLALVAIAAAGTWAAVRFLSPWASPNTAMGLSIVVGAFGFAMAWAFRCGRAQSAVGSSFLGSSAAAGFGWSFEAGGGLQGGADCDGGGDGGGGGGDGG